MADTEKYLESAAPLRGERRLPASKSLSNRALVISRLAGAKASALHRLAACDDTEAVTRALAALQTAGEPVLNVGAAGTAMRFLTAYCALKTPDSPQGSLLLTGSERMKHRPIAVLVDALRQLGASIGYAGETGYPPLRIRPCELAGGQIPIDGSISSQYISALLMVGPYMRQGLTLRFEGKVASRPYIQMTIELMRHFGARVDWQGDTITVAPGSYRPASYTVESDWSAASYWYEIVALSADPDAWVSLPGLQSDSLQGDSCVADWFARLGVSTEYHSEGVVLRKTQADKSPLQLDFSLSPDLAQTLVVTCCLLGVPFEFSGLESLKIKETDRIAALCSECAKLGFVLEEPAHGCLRCDSRRPAVPCQAEIETYDDHRMAMAFAPAVLTGTALNILCPGVVSKSYPDFWKEFEQSAR